MAFAGNVELFEFSFYSFDGDEKHFEILGKYICGKQQKIQQNHIYSYKNGAKLILIFFFLEIFI